VVVVVEVVLVCWCIDRIGISGLTICKTIEALNYDMFELVPIRDSFCNAIKRLYIFTNLLIHRQVRFEFEFEFGFELVNKIQKEHGGNDHFLSFFLSFFTPHGYIKRVRIHFVSFINLYRSIFETDASK
jgi:hypothetical protein